MNTTTYKPCLPAGVEVDASRGYDVLYRNRVLKHFDSYAEAAAFAAEKRARVLRFYGKKEEA